MSDLRPLSTNLNRLTTDLSDAGGNASTEFFGKLAYASFLLGPDAPAKSKKWDELSAREREWFRQSSRHYIDEIENAEMAFGTSQAPTE